MGGGSQTSEDHCLDDFRALASCDDNVLLDGMECRSHEFADSESAGMKNGVEDGMPRVDEGQANTNCAAHVSEVKADYAEQDSTSPLCDTTTFIPSSQILMQAVERSFLELSVVGNGVALPALLCLLAEFDAEISKLERVSLVELVQKCAVADESGGLSVYRQRLDEIIKKCVARVQGPLVVKYQWDQTQKILAGVATAGVVLTAGVGLVWCAAVASSTAAATALAAAEASAQAAGAGFFVSRAASATATAVVEAAQAAANAAAAAATGTGVATLVTPVATVGGATVGGVVACRNPWTPKKYNTYIEVLRVILDTLPPVPSGATVPYAAYQTQQMSIEKLEQAIADKWELLGYGTTKEKSLSSIVNTPEFSQHIGLMEKESATAILQRARAIYIIHKLKDLLQKTCFVGVVGAQNTGKSTLVRGMARCAGRSPNVPNIGLKVHTEEVVGYEIQDKLWVVDFPGCNSISEEVASSWQRFSHVPNFCVLLVRFTGDIDRDVADTYRRVKEGLGTAQVLVLLNKVDLTLQEEDELSPFFFNDCRDGFVETLGCAPEDIVFSVLDPRKLTPEIEALGVASVDRVYQLIVEQAVRSASMDSP
eukprot:TRINITY_DN671_c0_g1_i1.p1 TRINITY_DN671_c0_g1~~TRINITY_DN671_c0_g1_i1.p1  ORF type:complete len:597 (+),score=96.22 TRINITY_DN671_c0_g1_i1:117-1907(+)